MQIEIFQDTVCPWCWIGKKNLQKALQNGSVPATIIYRPYFLDPHTPMEGSSFQEAMLQKINDPIQLQKMLDRITETGEKVGIEFRFDLIKKMPNTRLSHQLMASVPQAQKEPLNEAILKAYFTEGLDIGDQEVLINIARSVGIEDPELNKKMNSDEIKVEVEKQLHIAQELQIRGVPFFVIDRKLALSGAHPPENFLKALEEARE